MINQIDSVDDTWILRLSPPCNKTYTGKYRNQSTIFIHKFICFLSAILANDVKKWKLPTLVICYLGVVIDTGLKHATLRNLWSTEYTEWKAFSPVVRIGTTCTPSSVDECVPTPFGSGGGDSVACGRGDARGVPIRTRDRHFSTLGKYVLRGMMKYGWRRRKPRIYIFCVLPFSRYEIPHQLLLVWTSYCMYICMYDEL